MTKEELSTLILGLAMAAAAGLMGSFAVMRRMTLASDALSHVALPGIGLALALHLHPFLGATVTLLLGAVLVWGVETRTRISTEAVVGVVFSAALAVGSLFTPGEELLEALFGRAGTMSLWELGSGLLGAVAVIAFVLARKARLVVALVSPDIARTAAIPVSRLSLEFLCFFALTVALGLRYLGVLLMGSLIIIPATTAKHLARNLSGMLTLSVVLAVLATLAGTWAARLLHRPSGPIIILFAGALFCLSLLRRRAS